MGSGGRRREERGKNEGSEHDSTGLADRGYLSGDYNAGRGIIGSRTDCVRRVRLINSQAME